MAQGRRKLPSPGRPGGRRRQVEGVQGRASRASSSVSALFPTQFQGQPIRPQISVTPLFPDTGREIIHTVAATPPQCVTQVIRRTTAIRIPDLNHETVLSVHTSHPDPSVRAKPSLNHHSAGKQVHFGSIFWPRQPKNDSTHQTQRSHVDSTDNTGHGHVGLGGSCSVRCRAPRRLVRTGRSTVGVPGRHCHESSGSDHAARTATCSASACRLVSMSGSPDTRTLSLPATEETPHG